MFNAFEIDFLPVGESSKSGDAIAMRYGNYESGKWKSQFVIIIDGGNSSSGGALVEHVQEIYKTNLVNQIILTHPDGDHACGLKTVLEEMKVGKLWMHRPWNHWEDIGDSIKDGRITKASFGERLKNAYQFAYNLEQLALKKGIKIVAPHQGHKYTNEDETIFRILGPSKLFYQSLLQASSKTPQMHLDRTFSNVTRAGKSKQVIETMEFETENLAAEHGETSAENDMSLITYLTVAGTKILFTADAGTMALYKAIAYSKQENINLEELDYFTVPHHGSRRNLSKGILEHIKAPTAFVSCAKEGDPKHPSPIVTNALARRNINVYQTKGALLSNRTMNLPKRNGMFSADIVPFQSTIEIQED